jgi:hypothetical protein
MAENVRINLRGSSLRTRLQSHDREGVFPPNTLSASCLPAAYRDRQRRQTEFRVY